MLKTIFKVEERKVKQNRYLLLLLLLSHFSRVWLFATPWTIAHQTPPSMEFFRQEYWNRLPFPSPGDLPDPGIKPTFPPLQADALPSELALVNYTIQFKLCPRDCTTIMCLARGQFLLPENLLSNPDILQWILWEWVWRIFLLLNSNLVILKCKLLE